MKKPNIGEKAPDLLLVDLKGNQVQLSETWSEENNALLVFLRHLG